MHNPNYVVAFNRDRDFYQVPLALAESARLSLLVTDLYEPSSTILRSLMRRAGLGHRFRAGLNPDKVAWCWRALSLQLVSLKLARSPEAKNRIFHAIDRALSEAAGAAAERRKAGLFLYSGYAKEAFLRPAQQERLKLLFVYHPQGDFIRDLLTRDNDLHPEAVFSHRAHLSEIEVNEGDRVKSEIAMADAIACASSFTAQSVRACPGAADKIVSVVPYGYERGVFSSAQDGRGRDRQRLKVLFVGQGVQRKGLHHLLKVWRQGFHCDADLTLVVSSLDPGIAKLIEALPARPRLLQRLTRKELDEEYAKADVFVLPSLVEGFGLVYSEAMAAGCYVIGTTNTGLPDLQLPCEVATVIKPGDLGGLAQALESAQQRHRSGELDRHLMAEAATERTWALFRRGINDFVDRAEL